MGRDPSSLRAGQHASSAAAFLTTMPAASLAVLAALRFSFARGLLSPLVAALSYAAGARLPGGAVGAARLKSAR